MTISHTNELPLSPSSNLLQRSQHIYYCRTDMEGYFTYVNPRFQRKFRYIAEDLVGVHSYSTIVEEDHPTCLKAILECMDRSDATSHCVLRKPNPEGGYFYTSWEFHLLVNAQGQPEEVECLGFDVTDAEVNFREALRQGQRLDEILTSMTDGFYTLDRLWRFTYVNPAAETVLQVSAADLLGKSIWALFPEKPEYQWPIIYRKAMQERTSALFEDTNPLTGNWYRTSVHPFDEGISVFFQNITEQKKQQAELLRSRNIMRAALDSSSNSIILLDREMRIIDFNRVAQRSARKVYHRDLVPGEEMLNFTLPGTRESFIAHVNQAWQGEKVSLELPLPVSPDKDVWFRVEYLPVTNEQDEVICVGFLAQNIDEQKRAELKILEQNEKLRRIALMQSHEIRAPLARAMGLMQVLAPEEIGPHNRHILGLVAESLNELDEIIKKVVLTTYQI